jgi:hypothetical protein
VLFICGAFPYFPIRKYRNEQKKKKRNKGFLYWASIRPKRRSNPSPASTLSSPHSCQGRKIKKQGLPMETPVVCCCCSCTCVVQSHLAPIAVVRGLVLRSPAVRCSSASQVSAVDVPLGTDFGSSISVNLSLDQTRTCSELPIAPLDFTLFCAIC